MLRIGSGAAASMDKFDPAIAVVESGVDYLVLEQLAELTTIWAGERAKAGRAGYVSLFEERLRSLLPAVEGTSTVVITNGGASDPLGAAAVARDVIAAKDLSIGVTAVTGDDCLDLLADADGVDVDPARALSANAYIGADALLDALAGTADDRPHLVIGGRIADPSLFVGPMMYEFDWDPTDWDRLGQATLIGHLLECSALVTGGYYMEPDRKPVPDYHDLGFPIAEVDPSGTGIVTKPSGTGGCVNLGTVREQLLYEIHDPTAYLTPDVTANFTTARLEQVGEDRVEVSGATGSERPAKLKAIVGISEGFKMQLMLPFGAPNAANRARQARSIVRRRLEAVHGIEPNRDIDLRMDLIGVNALFDGSSPLDSTVDAFDEIPPLGEERPEVLLWIAARSADRSPLVKVWHEARILPASGPAATGAAIPSSGDPDHSISRLVGVEPAFLDRELITARLKTHPAPGAGVV